GMHQGGGLMLTDVKHRTYVDVNEEGTTAAAVTVGGRRAYERPTNAVREPAFRFRVAREFVGDDPVHGGDSAPVANLLYSVFRNANSAARSPAGSARKRSRAFVASPPCSSTACSAVLARPSCRNCFFRCNPISGSVRNSV